MKRLCGLLLSVLILGCSMPGCDTGMGEARLEESRAPDEKDTPSHEILEADYLEIVHPLGSKARPGSFFGSATVPLDFDGDGKVDVAAGAPGECAVYVLFGPDFKKHVRFAPQGGTAAYKFGSELASSPLDSRPGDELVVGAPGCAAGGQDRAGKVFIFSRENRKGTVLAAAKPDARAGFGTSLAVGDVDRDPLPEVVIGAPAARVKGVTSGSVYLFDTKRFELQGRVDNPQKNRVGNFGHDLAVDDGNGDGKDDLFVVAIGNRAEDGQDRAGQIFYYPGPITGAPARVIESPVRKAGDVARFGMNIHVRDLNGDGCADLAVGSPRSDAGEVEDAGLGFLFRGPKFDPTKALMKIRSDPKPRKNDIVGFRTRMGNLLGDSSPDLIFSSLADPRYGHARALLIWDGSRIEGKLFVLEAMPGASDHYIQGISIAQLNGKGYEELILGDPNHNPEVGKNVGRVMIACFDESSF